MVTSWRAGCRMRSEVDQGPWRQRADGCWLPQQVGRQVGAQCGTQVGTVGNLLNDPEAASRFRWLLARTIPRSHEFMTISPSIKAHIHSNQLVNWQVNKIKI